MRITYRGVNGLIEGEVMGVKTEYTIRTPDGKTMLVDERSVVEKKDDDK